MTDRIVQLKNKNNDNIYPLAGGMLSNSVTTAMLQNGAVTSDKIDLATSTFTVKVSATDTSTTVDYTGTKIRLGGNLYLLAFDAQTSFTLQQQRHMTVSWADSVSVSSIITGSVNGCVSGREHSYMQYSEMNTTGADLVLISDGTSGRAVIRLLALVTID